MAIKTLILVFLVAALMISPMAFAQLNLVGQLLGVLNVQGQLFCTANGNLNGTSSPVFPNALVQLQCNGNTVGSATTNGSGVFSILLNPLQFVLTSLLNTCRLVVNTPLSRCDVTLPSAGVLISSLQVLGNTIGGLLGTITNIIPTGFQLFAKTN